MQWAAPDCPCAHLGMLSPNLRAGWELSLPWEWKALAGIRALHAMLLDRIGVFWKEKPFLSRTEAHVWHQKFCLVICFRMRVSGKQQQMLSKTKGPSGGHSKGARIHQTGLENAGEAPRPCRRSAPTGWGAALTAYCLCLQLGIFKFFIKFSSTEMMILCGLKLLYKKRKYWNIQGWPSAAQPQMYLKWPDPSEAGPALSQPHLIIP